MSEKNDKIEKDNKDLLVLTKEEIKNLDLKSEKTKKLINQYEEKTKKYAIWRNIITEDFKKWLRGEKVYNRKKKHVALYIPEEMKKKWQDFIKTKPNEISSLSDLIRGAVNKYIWESENSVENLAKLQPRNLSKISFQFKELLTSIKGYAQFILENYKDNIEEDILIRIQHIFDHSLLLENEIRSALDNVKTENCQYDILLIDDDVPTIRLLTDYFESEGCSCNGVVTGNKGLEELSRTTPKVILLDIILPDINGDVICKKIKSIEKFKEIPIYFETAITRSQVEDILNETKADGYILKPFNLFADFRIIVEKLKGIKSEI